MNRLEKFKKEVSSPIYITFSFELSKNRNEKSLFVFYEGEDRKYYNSRIKRYTDVELITHDCSGKRGVIEVYNNISEKHPDKVHKQCMFFVDKDFGLEEVPEEIYETPEYSVENFYIKKKSLENILKDEFGMSHLSKDYPDILSEYTSLYLDFEEKISLVLIWYLACKKNEFEVELTKAFSVKNLFKISASGLEVDSNISDIESVIFSYEKFIKQNISKNNKKKELYVEDLRKYEEKKSSIIETIRLEEKFYDKTLNLRGKFGLEFFQMILKYILQKNKEKKLKDNYKTVYLNVDSKNLLSVLDKYAITPPCLTQYIKSKI
ncbi:DUF4435 domain-containing protein [Lactococcus garvieae]|uniref:DUF4435 domain-containing protein n=1 Tax=Lactococcus garvieae TaxID=1363 RepID=UPI00255079B7|nr:DUF4435 domain-containing protein [Lactococcus garvieae]